MTTIKQTGYLLIILGLMGLIVLLVTLTGCEVKAANLDLYRVDPAPLSGNQKIAALIGYAIIDYKWTVNNIIKKPRNKELNPLLGKRPNREKLLAFGAIGVAAAYIVSRIDNPIATILLDSAIASEYQNLYENNNRRNRKHMPIVMCLNFKI